MNIIKADFTKNELFLREITCTSNTYRKTDLQHRHRRIRQADL